MFDLNIEFTGLCIFVPEPNPEAPTGVHVLLVAPKQEHAGCPTHHPRLFYDKAYDQANPTVLTNKRNCVTLNDKVLNLSRFLPTNAALSFKLDHLPNLSSKALTDQVVPPEFFRDGSPLLSARVTVAAGEGSDLERTGPWGMLGVPANDLQLAFAVQWKIMDVNSAVLDWELEGLNGREGHPLKPLTPVVGTSGRPEINLRIINVPLGEIEAFPKTDDKPPAFGVEAAHFGCHYDVWVKPGRRISPIYFGDDGASGGSGTSFSCMPAQARM